MTIKYEGESAFDVLHFSNKHEGMSQTSEVFISLCLEKNYIRSLVYQEKKCKRYASPTLGIIFRLKYVKLEQVFSMQI